MSVSRPDDQGYAPFVVVTMRCSNIMWAIVGNMYRECDSPLTSGIVYSFRNKKSNRLMSAKCLVHTQLFILSSVGQKTLPRLFPIF